jgi:hypothetical protein
VRYYNIQFADQFGKPIFGVPNRFTSHNAGIFNPGALEVEFDITNAFGHFLAAPTHLRIHNPMIEWVTNARLYNGTYCTIEAGFKHGLPLANPNQSGVIGWGIVQNSFANWIGTDLVLDFLIYPATDFGSPDTNYSFSTGPGTPSVYDFTWGNASYSPSAVNGAVPFLEALKATFNKLNITLNGILDEKLNAPPKNTTYGFFGTNFREFANYINDISLQVVSPPTLTGSGAGSFQKYNGVWLGYMPDGTVLAWDGTTPTKTIQLDYAEFVGQPTWLTEGGIVQSVHPMRNDISIGSKIKYPQNLPSVLNPFYAAAGRYNVLSASAQELYVQQVRHVGRFRDTSSTGWVTYINAAGAVPTNPYPEKVGVVEIGPLEDATPDYMK